MQVRRRVFPAALTVITTAALAVATAPAARAFDEPQAKGFSGTAVDLTDIVRLAPDADGNQIAPLLQTGRTNQQAPALQLRLPIRTEAAPGKQYATWQAGDQLTVTLPAGVTFASAPRVTPSDLTDVNPATAVTPPAPAMTATLVADGGASVTLQKPNVTVTLSADRSAARLLITNSQWSAPAEASSASWLNLTQADFTYHDDAANTDTPIPAGAQPGYLLTLDQLALNVSPSATGTVTATVTGDASNGFYGTSDYATYPAQAPAACTVGAAGSTRMASYVGGTTTLGFLPLLAVGNKQPAGQVVNATADLQQLPAMVLTGRFAAKLAYQLSADVVASSAANAPSLGSVLFDFPSHSPAIDYMDVKVTATGVAAAGVALAPSAGQYGIPRTTQLTVTSAAAGAATVTIANLRIAGYVPTDQMGAQAIPAGTLIRVKVAAPSTSQLLSVNDASTSGCLTKPGDSTYSQVAGPEDTSSLVSSTDLTVAAKATRTAGLNRYDTAGRLAQQYAALPGGAQPRAVVIANGENRKGGFDALSANYLAGRVGAPILLTSADTLPDETALALRAMLNGVSAPVTLYVMGKADSVSDVVVSKLTQIARQATSATVTAKRVSGDNRYATSAAAASIGAVGTVSFAKGSPQYKTAILASGLVSADALAAGPLSFSLGVPVLLTGTGALPPEVVSVIKKQGIKQVFALGGADRVSASQFAELRALGVTVIKRIAGKNRYATSADLYSFAARSTTTAAASGGGLGWVTGSTVYVANGTTGFPDALAVGPLAGAQHAALVTSGPAKLDPAVATFTKGQGVPLTALGQPATLSDALL